MPPYSISVRKHNALVGADVITSSITNPKAEIKPITSAKDNKVLFACVAKMQLHHKESNLTAQAIESEARSKIEPIYIEKQKEIDKNQ